MSRRRKAPPRRISARVARILSDSGSGSNTEVLRADESEDDEIDLRFKRPTTMISNEKESESADPELPRLAASDSEEMSFLDEESLEDSKYNRPRPLKRHKVTERDKSGGGGGKLPRVLGVLGRIPLPMRAPSGMDVAELRVEIVFRPSETYSLDKIMYVDFELHPRRHSLWNGEPLEKHSLELPGTRANALRDLLEQKFVWARLVAAPDEGHDRLCVELDLTEAALLDEDEPPDAPSRRPQHARLRQLLTWLVPELRRAAGCDEADSPRRPSETDGVQQLLAEVREAQEELLAGRWEEAAPPPGLLASLRPYQAQALHWMLRRERDPPSPPSDALHPLWRPFYLPPSPDADSAPSASPLQLLYCCPFDGRLSRRRFPPPDGIRGGILADEMGLGKTVEVLALILANPPPAPPVQPEWQERIECVCGARHEDANAEAHGDGDAEMGKWVACDACRAWLHAACVSFDPDAVYACPTCASGERPLLEARATLIVCPASILSQWRAEILRHTAPGALRVLVYTGLKRGKYVPPHKLAAADVILVAYETLRAELYYASPVDYSRLRHRKRFALPLSPLAHLRWWRLVLDECQMVETGSKSGELASRLEARHRWSVSGTPMLHGEEGLRGILSALQLEPWNVRLWFQRGLMEPYRRGHKAPLLELLRDVIWRRSKEEVAAQLQLPPLEERVVRVRLSELEQYYYERKFEECADLAQQELKRLERVFGHAAELHLSRADRARLLRPLLQLRQACDHPQVGARAIRPLQRTPMPMSELLEALVDRARLEAEEAHRGLLVASNALAALALLSGRPEEALQLYRASLRSVALNRDAIGTDLLQELHIVANLRELLESGRLPDPPLASELADLRATEQRLRERYLQEARTRARSAAERAHAARRHCEDLLAGFAPLWFVGCLRGLPPRARADLVSRLLDEARGERFSRLGAARDAFGYELVLARDLEELLRAREAALAAVQPMLRAYAGLEAEDRLDAALEEAAACARCHASSLAGRLRVLARHQSCPVCRALDALAALELRLFARRHRTLDLDEAPEREGALDADAAAEAADEALAHRSELERALRSLASAFRSAGIIEPALVEQQGEFFDLLRKELLACRAAVVQVRSHLDARDELAMACSRLRLRAPGEQVAEAEKHGVVEAHELEARRMAFEREKQAAGWLLSQALTQLSYLRSLKGARPEEARKLECPVCMEALAERNRVVLPCGHQLCHGCSSELLKHKAPQAQHVRCPSCRAPARVEELSVARLADADADAHVDAQASGSTPPEAGGAEAEITVKGSWGSKIEALVRELLRVQAREPQAKSLVFSEWEDVLRIISQALEANGVAFLQLRGGRSSGAVDAVLQKFKSDPNVNVLLLPYRSGANGLNLTEATKVFLCEPHLHLGTELQAISRVHRMGQIRPCELYRFVTRGTIEERIAQRPASPRAAAPAREVELRPSDVRRLFAPIGAESAEFWNGLVQVRPGRVLSRQEVVEELHRAFTWECREKGLNHLTEPHLELHGRRLPVVVAERLQALPSTLN